MQQLNGFLGSTISSLRANRLYLALNSYRQNTQFEDWHAHENASISFLLNGAHKEEMGGKILKRNPGDIKFIPVGEVHRCTGYAEGTRKINIELPDVLLKEMDIKQDGIENLLLSCPQTKFTLLRIYQEINNRYDRSSLSLQLLLFELLQPAPSLTEHYPRQAPIWVSRLKELLNEHYAEQLDLTAIAKVLSVHPVTISRYFPQYFDVTVSVYLRNVRVEKSLSMIKGTNKSLTEIGLACGFADQSHFTHTFKKVTGFLPKEYRSI